MTWMCNIQILQYTCLGLMWNLHNIVSNFTIIWGFLGSNSRKHKIGLRPSIFDIFQTSFGFSQQEESRPKDIKKKSKSNNPLLILSFIWYFSCLAPIVPIMVTRHLAMLINGVIPGFGVLLFYFFNESI